MNHCQTCGWWLPNRPEFRIRNAGLCLNPKINHMTLAELGCAHHVSANAVEVNVPQHVKNGRKFVNNIAVDGPVEILIVTHAKDIQWLVYCLQSINKFCTGFQGVTVAIPRHEGQAFWYLRSAYGGVRWHEYDEVEGKGMIQHMAKMALADTFLPATTKYVLTCDADCIFRMPTRPEDYFSNGKPYYIYRTWESLTTEDPHNPGSKVVSDCYQWRTPTDAQLGFASDIYGMCMNTIVFPIEFFAPYREHIANVHGVTFMDYMLSGRNSFPQDRMDFTAMGAYAWRFMRDRFTWFNVADGNYPMDRKQAYWSHGGISKQIRDEIEGILNRYVPSAEEIERMAQ